MKLLKKLKPNMKIKKVLQITVLVKKLAYVIVVTKNIYVGFRKMSYIIQYRNKIWLLPNLVLKTVFLFIVLIKQLKGVFKIVIFFLPRMKNITTKILFINDKYKKYLIGSINPIIRNSMSFSKVYASTYLNKGFMYAVVLILSTAIFLPQKAAALNADPDDISRWLKITFDTYKTITQDSQQCRPKEFVLRHGVDYTTQEISKNVALSLSYARKCSPIYNGLPRYQRLVYKLVEASIHTYAITAQMNLCFTALDIDPETRRNIINRLYSDALNKLLNDKKSESEK